MSSPTPWDDAPPPAPPVAAPSAAPWDDPVDASGEPVSPALLPQDWISKLYHPLIEGAAVSAGSTAGAAIGTLADPVVGPAGTMAGAVAGGSAFFPAGKYVADAIDKIRGVATEQNSLLQQMGEGAKVEMEGQALGAAAKPVLDAAGGALSAVLPGAKMGEAVSGTPSSNLSRAFKNGFVKTFLSPLSVAEASENYGDEFTKLMGDYYSPEEQADLLLNPNGIAKEKLSNVIQQAIKGDPIDVKDAVAARQGINQLMPSQTAKSLPRVMGFSSFRGYLNDIIGKEAPDFKEASDDYAASKLRDQLLKFGQVNKSNPNEYSKLGAMMMKGMTGLAGFGLGSGHPLAPVIGASVQAASSPFIMGLVSAASGSGSRAVAGALANPLIQRAAASALDDYFGDGDTAPGQGGNPGTQGIAPSSAGNGNQ